MDMETQVKRMVVADRDIADVFWRMTCMAFCTGLAVSLAAASVVLLIAGIAG